MAYLTVISPEVETFRHEIAAGTLHIGRSSRNELVIADPHVSRSHAEIIERDGAYYIVNTSTSNPTLVNDRPADEPTLLRPSDRIRMGSTTLVFDGDLDSAVVVGDPVTTFDSAITREETDVPPPRSALSVVLEAGREPTFHRPIGETLSTLLEIANQAVPFERGAVLLKRDAQLLPEVIRVPEAGQSEPMFVSKSIVTHVLREGVPVLTSDAMSDVRFRHSESLQAQGVRSVLCVPIGKPHEAAGVIYVDCRRQAGRFDADSLRVLSHIANVAALKIEGARLFGRVVLARRTEEELQLAWDIQRNMLPAQPPAIAGYSVEARTRPSRSVGGDCYDYLRLRDGRWGMSVADAAGHGVDAALLMTYFQASLRALCEHDLPLDEMCRRLNLLLHERIPSNRFITFFCGVLDPARHTFEYVNAGHPPPLLVRGDGGERWLTQTGLPIGMFPESQYESGTLTFAREDFLVCYSDGLVDARNVAAERFGLDRLVEAVFALRGEGPRSLVEGVLAMVDDHSQGVEEDDDDLTILVMRRLAPR